MWHCVRSGSGPPLVLLHGIGMSHTVWNPVLPFLGAQRAVYAFDIAGFGATPRLPRGTAPTVGHLVNALDASLREVGVTFPVDIAGNSLGGTLALEAARRGIARRVVAISPAGLWEHRPPAHVKYVFAGARVMATRAYGPLIALLRWPALRELVLSVPLSVGSRRMPYDDAVRTIGDLANAVAFEDTFNSTKSPFSAHEIATAVTVAFGDRDFVLTTGARRRCALPDHVRWLTMRSWGHVPMWVDPAGVANVILTGVTDAAAISRPRPKGR